MLKIVKQFSFVIHPLIFSLIFLGIPLPSFSQESITITTYYPSPYAVHGMSRLFPRDDIIPGSSCANEGEMFYYGGTADTQGLYFCDDNGSWQLFAGAGPGGLQVGTHWTRNQSNQLYPTDLSDRVGIGTTDPQRQLHVAGDTGSWPQLHIEDRSGEEASISFWPRGINPTWRLGPGLHGLGPTQFGLGTNNSVLMTITPGGNVGIGTPAPQEPLHVNGNIRLGGYDSVLHAQAPNQRYYDLIGTYQGWDQNTVYIAGYNAINTTGRSTTKVVIGGPGSRQMSFDVRPTFNAVGIGTTQPSAMLEVVGDVKATDVKATDFQRVPDNCFRQQGRPSLWTGITACARAGGKICIAEKTNAGIYVECNYADIFGCSRHSEGDFCQICCDVSGFPVQ